MEKKTTDDVGNGLSGCCPFPYGKANYLEKHTYHGYTYFIRGNLMGCPCVYVVLHDDDPWIGLGMDDSGLEEIDQVHGGITYSEDHYPWEPETNRTKVPWVIGWDYAHAGDAVVFVEAGYMLPGTKWKMEDLHEHAKKEIDVIIAAKGKH